MTEVAKYGQWVISYDPKPIPDRKHNWDFVHQDYGGENGLSGTGESIAHCIEQIKEIDNQKELF